MKNFLKSIAAGPRIILVTGHFGSGKTEFSVSLAFALAAMRDEGVADLSSLALCDLDLENPYFRSRELTEEMESVGIRVYSDPYHGRNGSSSRHSIRPFSPLFRTPTAMSSWTPAETTQAP